MPIVNNQSLNDTVTNEIVSFEQLGPDHSTKVALALFVLCMIVWLLAGAICLGGARGGGGEGTV